MNNKIKQFGENVKFKWQDLNTMKRAMIVLGILSIFVIGGSTYYLMNRTEYSVLFSDLSEQDAGTITKDLQSQNIEYKLSNGGKTISVAKDKVDAYRINLAVDNKLPNASKGLELFDNTNLMTTDEDRKIMYQRAVTGELQRAIESLSAVDKAKVLLVMPDNSVFADKNKVATASVVLTLKRPNISDTAVQGIVNLVSGAVENLTPENVKVVDSNGRTLTSTKDQNGQVSSLSDRYIEIKRNYEKSLEDKLSTLLERIYGAGNYQLSINLDLNFDSIESTKVTYGNTAIRSENVQANGNQADIQRAQNGTIEDNVTNVTGNNNRDGGKSFERSINNEVGSETVKTVNAPSAIKRLTSSIVVSKQLNAAEQENLQKIVESAIGYNADRGDVLSIEGMDFSKAGGTKADTAANSGAAGASAMKKYVPYLVIAGIILALLIAGIVGFLLVKRRRNREYDDYEEAEDEYEEEYEAAEQDITNNRSPLKKKQSEPLEEMSVDDQEGDRIKDFADNNPEVAAELIKAWMKENS